jgi:toxin ParE1/3/4
MAPRRVAITWSPEAKSDLQQLHSYIAAANRPAARRLITRIKSAVKGLREHPELGRVVPELEDPILRERLVGQYRIIYTFSHDKIEIAAIWHSAELLE